jgi:hypothetical protein
MRGGLDLSALSRAPVVKNVPALSKALESLPKPTGRFGVFNALWAPFRYLSEKSITSIATANVQVFDQMVARGIDYFRRNPNAEADPAFRFTPDMLGMKGGAYFSDEGAFRFYRDRLGEYQIGNLEDVVRGAMRRAAKGETLLTRDQALGVAMMAVNEVSLESSINTRPVEWFNNPVWRFGGLLLGWPISKVNQINEALKTTDGRFQVASIVKGIGIMALWSLPAGLAYSLLMDAYDRELLAKEPNLRKLRPIDMVPVVGVANAAAESLQGDRVGALAILERAARAGTFGLAGDAVSSVFNIVDPQAGQRDFDLNSRILIFSQFANMRDIVRDLIHTEGAVTYASTIRPALNAFGFGGQIQATQILNNAFGLSNSEAQVTNRINVNNYLRAAGREAGLELRMGAGRSSPTPVSVWIRQMQLKALSNDRIGFLEAYRNAVSAARARGEESPESYVLTNWKSRNPLTTTFRTKPSEAEMGRLMSALGEDGRMAVNEALSLFDRYTDMIAPSDLQEAIARRMGSAMRPRASRVPNLEDVRRRAALQAMGL